MKKTKLTRSLLAACSVVALSAVMYGCVHDGGGDEPATEMEAPEPMPEPEPEPEEEPEPEPEEEPEPEMEPADEIAALQAQINELRAELGLDPINIDELTGSVADLMQQVMDLQDEIDMRDMAAEEAAAMAAAADAEALFNGLDMNRGTPGNVDLAISAQTVMATYGDSSTVTATVTLDGTAISPDPMVAATETMVPSLGMWSGTELFVDMDGEMPSHTVTVYTDVMAPTPTPFDEAYGTNAALVMDADVSADAHVALIMAAGFDHTGAMDHAPGATTADQVTVRVPGTFHGAAGQYQCTADSANDCVSHEDDNGVRLTGAGTPIAGWEFVPNPGAMVMVADSTYLYFGWWLYKDSMGPEVDAFHGVTGSPTAIDDNNFTALSGTATYSGAAAGKVAIDPVAPGTVASGGHWTADAMLTADFGSETTNGTISGMIDGFMFGGEETDWSVALGEVALTPANPTVTFTSAGDGATTAGDDVVWTINGEAAPEAGMWSGNLHNQGDDNIPTGATGEFSAVYSEGGHNIGQMVGAFGAHVDE